MRLAAYYRVSTKAQGEEDRYGLARQRADVKAFVDRNGHEIVAEFEDVGFSGATAERPRLAELLKLEGAEGVVVPSWDRLARDAMLDGYLRYRLQELGLAVLSATQENGIDPQAKLMQTMLAAVAEFERSLITNRLAGSRREKAAKGGYAHGRPPYGFKTGNGHLIEDPLEQETLKVMWRLRDEGKTYMAIAHSLNDAKVPSRKGAFWQQSTVFEILTREEDGVPYGYSAVDYDKIVPNADEQRLLTQMRELRAMRPRPSYSDVAAAVNAQGLKRRNGQAWRTPSIVWAMTSWLRYERKRVSEQMLALGRNDPAYTDLVEQFGRLCIEIDSV